MAGDLPPSGRPYTFQPNTPAVLARPGRSLGRCTRCQFDIGFFVFGVPLLIPAWHIGILAVLYAAEYFWRAWMLRDRRFMYVGKAIGRLILAAPYFYFAFVLTDADVRTVWIRWSLFMYLAIDLIFVAVDHIMRLVKSHAKYS